MTDDRIHNLIHIAMQDMEHCDTVLGEGGGLLYFPDSSEVGDPEKLRENRVATHLIVHMMRRVSKVDTKQAAFQFNHRGGELSLDVHDDLAAAFEFMCETDGAPPLDRVRDLAAKAAWHLMGEGIMHEVESHNLVSEFEAFLKEQ